MKVNANAKINLGLDIVSKREDGYHELNTLFCELKLHDEIDIEITEKIEISVTCSDQNLSCGSDNLAYRAAEILFERYNPGRGVKIHIIKNIPMGAGLGGGSSDAAAVLKTVNSLFKFNLDNDELRNTGAKIGADVPFFIEGKMAQAKGIGEKLMHFEGCHLPPMLIIKPEISIPTGWAYNTVDESKNVFHPDIESLIRAVKTGDYEGICRYAGNTFENAITERFPVIKQIKSRMRELGAGTCVMTGSGSALFAIFKSEEMVLNATEILKKEDTTLKLYPETGGSSL